MQKVVEGRLDWEIRTMYSTVMLPVLNFRHLSLLADFNRVVSAAGFMCQDFGCLSGALPRCPDCLIRQAASAGMRLSLPISATSIVTSLAFLPSAVIPAFTFSAYLLDPCLKTFQSVV